MLGNQRVVGAPGTGKRFNRRDLVIETGVEED